MYSKLAKYYDKMHHFMNYQGQVDFIIKQFKKHNQSGKKNVLDVACGTGNHANLLMKGGFNIVGIDKSNYMLEQARKKNKSIKYVLGDMKDFKLDEKFDLVICMYNSILYNLNKEEIKKTLINFKEHLDNGGILIFDAFEKSAGIEKKDFLYELKEDNIHIISVYLTRYNQKDNHIIFDNYFIINEELVHDYHIAGAFTHHDIVDTLREVGFEIIIAEKFRNAFSYTYVCKKKSS